MKLSLGDGLREAPLWVLTSPSPPYFQYVFCRGTAPLRRKLALKNALTGEASPNYIFHLNGLELITRTLPGIKIIAILLDPVKRAFSHYPHMREQGKESLSFEQANEAEEGRLRGVTGKIAACNRHTKPVFADLRAGSINFWWRFDLHHHWGWRPLQGFQFLAIRIHRCAMRSSAPKQARTAEGSLPI